MKMCISFKDRLIGNMFKKEVIDMCFPKCNSVHTMFMKKAIDIYMTDKNFKVLYGNFNKIHKKSKKFSKKHLKMSFEMTIL